MARCHGGAALRRAGDSNPSKAREMVLDAIAAAMAVAGNANSLRASSLSSEAAKFGSHPSFVLVFSS